MVHIASQQIVFNAQGQGIDVTEMQGLALDRVAAVGGTPAPKLDELIFFATYDASRSMKSCYCDELCYHPRNLDCCAKCWPQQPLEGCRYQLEQRLVSKRFHRMGTTSGYSFCPKQENYTTSSGDEMRVFNATHFVNVTVENDLLNLTMGQISVSGLNHSRSVLMFVDADGNLVHHNATTLDALRLQLHMDPSRYPSSSAAGGLFMPIVVKSIIL